MGRMDNEAPGGKKGWEGQDGPEVGSQRGGLPSEKGGHPAVLRGGLRHRDFDGLQGQIRQRGTRPQGRWRDWHYSPAGVNRLSRAVSPGSRRGNGKMVGKRRPEKKARGRAGPPLCHKLAMRARGRRLT